VTGASLANEHRAPTDPDMGTSVIRQSIRDTFRRLMCEDPDVCRGRSGCNARLCPSALGF
jgi:hypothetical protein